ILHAGRRADASQFGDIAEQQSLRDVMPPAEIGEVRWSPMNSGLNSRRAFSHDKDDLERSMQARFTSNAIVEAARAFAGASGKMMPGNDLKASVRQFDDASSNYYSLGFRPGHDDDGKYHTLTVKLTKPGQYKVQHRAGYSSMSVDAQLGRALRSHIVSTLDTS